MERTAIFVDGAFFIKRALRIFGPLSPSELAHNLWKYSLYHLYHRPPSGSLPDDPQAVEKLYRIFFYDCPPMSKKIEHPLTGKQIDFAKSERAIWRLGLHEELRKKRKVALRLGCVDDTNFAWTISNDNVKKLCKKKICIDDLSESDITLNTKQKGVDMRIGLDIASIAYKKQATKIVLLSGDSDFVPAAKLARREGIDFVLDPMWAPIKPDLHEHIDGLRSTFPRPVPRTAPVILPPVPATPVEPTP